MELPKPYKIIRFYTVEEGKEVLDTDFIDVYSKEQMIKYREDTLEEVALLIENGSFLHDQSPSKLFADQLVPKIRRLK